MNIQQFDGFISELPDNDRLINLSNTLHELRIFVLDNLDKVINDVFKVKCDIEDVIDDIIGKLLSSNFSDDILFINRPLSEFVIKGKLGDLVTKSKSVRLPKGSELRKLWWLSDNFSDIINLSLLFSKIFILVKHCRVKGCFIYPDDFGFGIDIIVKGKGVKLIFNLILKGSLCKREDSLIPFFEIKIRDYTTVSEVLKGISELSNAKLRINKLLIAKLNSLKVR